MKKVTYKKHGGDDIYSWAVFIDGRFIMGGLSRSEAQHYKKVILERIEKDKATA